MKAESTDGTPIVRLAARGDGVTGDGRFIPYAVPGDRVLADGSVLVGEDHLTPVCRHFGVCGGCQLQHASESALQIFLRERILSPLDRVGIAPGQVMPVHLSPPGARRRTAMRATRTQGEVRIGFNAIASHDVVDLAECPVLDPRLFALVEPLRALLAPWLKERSAIGITMTLTDSGVDLLLSNLKERALPAITGLARFAEDAGLARLSVRGTDGIDTIVERTAPVVLLAGVPVKVPHAVFLQATRDSEQALVDAVEAIVGPARRVADLFSGIGTFTFPLVRGAPDIRRRVLAADAARPAIDALKAAADGAELAVDVAHRDLFRQPLSARQLAAFDAVVIDPPRAGAKAQMAAIAESGVARVAAVSCNPATFARDARILTDAGYQLRRLWPVGQFRWSTHVELVAEFTR